MGGRKFNPKRAPTGQLKVRVDITCRVILAKSAGGDVRKVNMEMVQRAAQKNQLPLQDLTEKLRRMGAPI